MKVSIETIQATLTRKKFPAAQVKETIDELKKLAHQENEAAKEDGNSGPKLKNQTVIVAVNDDSAAEKVLTDSFLYVVQIKEGEDHTKTLENLKRAAFNHNAESRSGRKNPILKFGELFSVVKRKFTKDQNVNIKTKEPCIVLVTKNKLDETNANKVAKTA